MYLRREDRIGWCANARTGSRWQRDILFGDRQGNEAQLPGRGFKKHQGHHSGPFLAGCDSRWTIGMIIRDPFDVLVSFFYGTPRPPPGQIPLEWVAKHDWVKNDMMYPNLWQAKALGADVFTWRYEDGLVSGMDTWLQSNNLPPLTDFERRHVVGRSKHKPEVMCQNLAEGYEHLFEPDAWERVQLKLGTERRLLGYG